MISTVKRYMLSTSNIAGGIAASLVAFLYIVGIFDHYWIFLAGVAYGIGALTFVADKPPEMLEKGLDTSEYIQWLRSEIVPKLPTTASQTLQRILKVVDDIWPRLKEMQEQGLVDFSSRDEIKQSLTLYLPELLTNYLRLPTAYAKTHKINGQTPTILLEEQLTMLENHVIGIRDNVYARDVEALQTHGKFLKAMLDPNTIIR